MQVLSNGKVRRSKAEWEKIITEYEASGQSQEGFCKGQGLSVTSFGKWRGLLEGGSTGGQAFMELAPAAATESERRARVEFGRSWLWTKREFAPCAFPYSTTLRHECNRNLRPGGHWLPYMALASVRATPL